MKDWIERLDDFLKMTGEYLTMAALVHNFTTYFQLGICTGLDIQ
jgi:hypothetical protein